MLQIELDEQEQQVLCSELTDTLSDLRAEIGRTDSYDYRMMLKERESVLNKIVDALESCTEENQPAARL